MQKQNAFLVTCDFDHKFQNVFKQAFSAGLISKVMHVFSLSVSIILIGILIGIFNSISN